MAVVWVFQLTSVVQRCAEKEGKEVFYMLFPFEWQRRVSTYLLCQGSVMRPPASDEASERWENNELAADVEAMD